MPKRTNNRHNPSDLTTQDAELVLLLATASGGLMGAIRSIMVERPGKRDRHLSSANLSTAWTALATYQATRDSIGDSGAAGPWPEDALADEAVSIITSMSEAATLAITSIARGSPVASIDTLQPLLMADAQFSSLIRQVGRPALSAVTRQLWGRDAIISRLR